MLRRSAILSVAVIVTAYALWLNPPRNLFAGLKAELICLPAEHVRITMNPNGPCCFMQQTILRKTGNLTAVTGAEGSRILGAIYPA